MQISKHIAMIGFLNPQVLYKMRDPFTEIDHLSDIEW